jgi:hypothetical protein
MSVSAVYPAKHPGKVSRFLTAVVRVLFATLLFTAGGMGLGLLLGIVILMVWGAAHGGQVDMRNAYRHIAIPFAAVVGSAAFVGAVYLEKRARRTPQGR